MASNVLTAYPADRAAALAGVPKSTLHYWTRTKLVVPSVSEERVKLWSFENLIALRMIDWLRRDKVDSEGRAVSSTPMPQIRRAIERLDDLDRSIWTEVGESVVRVDGSGRIYVEEDGAFVTPGGQLPIAAINLIAPFHGRAGLWGPDLLQPRPQIRIVPGKLAGEPHVQRTRVETRALSALAARAFSVDEIASMYPFLGSSAVEEALDLESQLADNLAA